MTDLPERTRAIGEPEPPRCEDCGKRPGMSHSWWCLIGGSKPGFPRPGSNRDRRAKANNYYGREKPMISTPPTDAAARTPLEPADKELGRIAQVASAARQFGAHFAEFGGEQPEGWCESLAWLLNAVDELAALQAPAAPPPPAGPVQGVTFLLVKDGAVLMEKCPKKAARHGGEWFIPGGRIEMGELPSAALCREMREELGCKPMDTEWMPLVDCSGGGTGHFLMRPFLIRKWDGEIPDHCLDHPEVPLRWVSLEEARQSPAYAVRAMLAALTADARLRLETEVTALVGVINLTKSESLVRDSARPFIHLEADPRAPMEVWFGEGGR